MPIALGVFGFVLLRRLAWDLIEEVYDYGAHLVVKNGGEEDTIALSNIMNVSVSTLTNRPPNHSSPCAAQKVRWRDCILSDHETDAESLR